MGEEKSRSLTRTEFLGAASTSEADRLDGAVRRKTGKGLYDWSGSADSFCRSDPLLARGRSRLNLAPALTTAFTSNGRLALPLPLGARLLVEATLPEFRIEPRPLHLTLESAECPLETFVVLNRYFQRTTTPLLYDRFHKWTEDQISDQEEKIVTTV